MERAKLNFIVDLAAVAAFLASLITGVIKFPGFLEAIGLRYGSLPMDEISFIHDWGSILFGVLIAVHLALHWRWIASTTKSIFRWEGK